LLLKRILKTDQILISELKDKKTKLISELDLKKTESHQHQQPQPQQQLQQQLH
jgi:hypothetical protein